MNDISYLALFFIIIPIIATWLAYRVGNKIYKYDWQAFHFAVNTTTVFYLTAVNLLLIRIFDQQFIGITVAVLLFILTIILISQWKKHTEVILWKGIKVLWRITFLLFFVLYVTAIAYTLIQAIIAI
ncbi:DUF3397 family protein [Virgibacillus sp. W0181]|uniref:DUF3397 family protein n=1 Tax=Virgibacillus sp. W0181 TaxID=3391581 RepID=UPI003F4861E3